MEKILKVCILVVFIVCIVGSAVLFKRGEKSSCVQIYINSQLYKSIDLSSVSQPYEIKLGKNTILVESDGVTMTDAACPDKVCVKRGKMKGGAPIICAPHGVYISFSGEVDAVSW